MARVPIIQLGRIIIATVQEDLCDRDALALQDELGQAIERGDVRGVLIDISVVETVDSYLGRVLRDTVLGARLLGAETIVVGIRPAVAVTLVELGLELPGVRTALNPLKGLALLRGLIAQEGRHDGRRR